MKFNEFKLCDECMFCKSDMQYHEDYRHPDWVIHEWISDCCYCDKIGIGNCIFCSDYCRNSECTRILHEKQNQCCYCEEEKIEE